MSALPYFLAYLTPLSVVLGTLEGGLWTFQTLVWIYLVIPSIDGVVGVNRRNRPEAEALAAGHSIAYRLPLWLYAPTQAALIAWALWTVANRPLAPLELAGLTLSLGAANGVVGITVAHELMHRRGALERALARVLMASVSYTHFCIEHIHGHHRNVGTPGDPATARLGESLYAFLRRCVAGSLRSAWTIECARLARRGRARWGPGNAMLRYGLAQALIYAAVAAAFGWLGLVVFMLQGAVAFSILEVINYVEHYGLARRRLGPERFEPVSTRHSWNSSHRVSNWFLFELARHTDHHLDPGRPYPALRHVEDSPQLPSGYGGMFLLALVPPLWRRVMDSRAAAWAGAGAA